MVVRAAVSVAFLFATLVSARAQQPEALSLLGQPLAAPSIPDDTRRKLEADLAETRATYNKDPNNVDAIIWLGRRTAYLSRFGEAIEIYTRGIEAHADEPRLYRHRGHRFITIRKFDLAIKDLQKAAELVEGKPDEVEPDGQPNDRNVPTSTLQTNIYYHLGLAHYLKAEFPDASRAFQKCLDLAKNPDMQVAATNWLYMTLRRMDRPDQAKQTLDAIKPGMDVIENKAYYSLLLFYKGLTPRDTLTGKGTDGVTLAYGLANYDFYSGANDKGVEQFKRIVDKQRNEWPAFSYIAAESEAARIAKTEHKKKKKHKK
jgi:tetratricopeptide (TPR) repeat protein